MATGIGRLAIGGIAGTLLLAMSGMAKADAIDGDWCRPGGKHMTIKGADIVTPNGTRMKGNYSRHAFSYVIPPADPGAGQTVFMVLLNEETLDLRIGTDPADAAQAEPEVWNRCREVTSSLWPLQRRQ